MTASLTNCSYGVHLTSGCRTLAVNLVVSSQAYCAVLHPLILHSDSGFVIFSRLSEREQQTSLTMQCHYFGHAGTFTDDPCKL